jgi:MFS family permease
VRRLLILACVMVFIDTIFYAALAPLLPQFVDRFELSKSMAGVLSGAFGVGVLVSAVPSAYIAARLGARGAALIGLTTIGLSTLLFGFAGAAWALVSLRFSGGFGSGVLWVAAFTWIVSQAPEERRGTLIGTLISMAVVGAMLGPVLGGVAATLGTAPVFATVAAAAFVVAFWASRTPAPKPAGLPPVRKVFAAAREPRLALGLALISFAPLLFGTLAVLAPLSLARLGWSAAAIGALFLAAAVFEAMVHPLFGRWSDKVGYRIPILAALGGSLVVLISLPWATSAIFLALLVLLAAVLFNAPLVPGTAMFTRTAEKAGLDQPLAFGATNFGWAAGFAAGAGISGALADLGGDTLAYLTLALVTAAAMPLMWRTLQ